MSTLVSVIIVTYNSADFILETLESVANLTWQDMELIITDDCSADHTVKLSENWLKDHQKRFRRTAVVTSGVNTGVSANANRGLKEAAGEWVKFLGGDDAFAPGFLTKSMAYVTAHPEVRVLFSQLDVYRETFEKKNYLRTTPEEIASDSIFRPGRTVEGQFRMLLCADRIHFTPTAFLHRQTLLSVGGFDERFRDFEDYTLWLNLTRNGHKLHFMHEVTVKYRMHDRALNNKPVPRVVNPNYFKEEKMRRIYTYPYMPLDLRLQARFIWVVGQIFRWERLNRYNPFSRFTWNLLTGYLNPFTYYIAIKKRLRPELRENELYL